MQPSSRENSNSPNPADSLPPISLFRWNTTFGSPYMGQLHVSPQHKIVIFNTASGLHHLQEKEIPVSSQSIHFIESGKTHRFELGRNTDVCIIYFSNNFIISTKG